MEGLGVWPELDSLAGRNAAWPLVPSTAALLWRAAQADGGPRSPSPLQAGTGTATRTERLLRKAVSSKGPPASKQGWAWVAKVVLVQGGPVDTIKSPHQHQDTGMRGASQGESVTLKSASPLSPAGGTLGRASVIPSVRWELYSFSMAAVTNHRKLNCSTNANVFS